MNEPIMWALITIFSNPQISEIPHANPSYIFTTEADCKEAMRLRQEIVRLKDEKVTIRCAAIISMPEETKVLEELLKRNNSEKN